MRKFLSLLIALVLTFTVCSVYAADGDVKYQIVRCPDQGFSTLCSPDYSWTYNSRDGVTIYTEHEGSIPYVLVYQSEDWIVDAMTIDYIHENYTPHMQKQYGSDLVSYQEYDAYTIGGRSMPAAVYTYRLQGYLIDMVRAYDTQNGHTVIYTAKYIQGRGDATRDALDLAASCFRPWEDYYSSADYSKWRYETAETESGNIIYVFPEVFITLPADWKGLYDVRINGDRSISFYHSMSRRMWNSREGFEGGLLFSLGYSETEDYRNMPSYEDLGEGENGYYYLIYPTDYQAYANIPQVRSEYDAMWSEVDFIAQNSLCYSFLLNK